MSTTTTNVDCFKRALQTIPDGEIPILVPVFNLCTYANNMVHQLISRGVTSFIICDNASTYPPMIQYLDALSKSQRVVRFNENLGPRIFAESLDFLDILPEYFVITDPDLILNDQLPGDFIHNMKDVINAYNVAKVGLALDIYDKCDKFFNKDQVQVWESKYWLNKVPALPNCISDPIYIAPIDTTFCLFKKSKYVEELLSNGHGITATSALRIAGRFTCEHTGWWLNQPVPHYEMEYYKNTQTWSSTCNERKKTWV
jgi:hypothetical protein